MQMEDEARLIRSKRCRGKPEMSGKSTHSVVVKRAGHR